MAPLQSVRDKMEGGMGKVKRSARKKCTMKADVSGRGGARGWRQISWQMGNRRKRRRDNKARKKAMGTRNSGMAEEIKAPRSQLACILWIGPARRKETLHTQGAHSPHKRGEDQGHGEARENTSGAGDARRHGRGSPRPRLAGLGEHSQTIGKPKCVPGPERESVGQAVCGVGRPSCGERPREYALVSARLVPGGTDAGKSSSIFGRDLGDLDVLRRHRRHRRHLRAREELRRVRYRLIFRSPSTMDPSASSDETLDECKRPSPCLRRPSSNWFTVRGYSTGPPVDMQKLNERLGTIVPCPFRPSFPFCSVRFNAGPADVRERVRTGAAHQPPPGRPDDDARACESLRGELEPQPVLVPSRLALAPPGAPERYMYPNANANARGARGNQASTTSASEWAGESASESEVKDSATSAAGAGAPVLEERRVPDARRGQDPRGAGSD
ncbi:hypothetical protein FB451DRAFT_1190371 [Mycena latifolia]|nr:hypothetical protein FB451DRAFT_1190371 [Mycena latifolia]